MQYCIVEGFLDLPKWFPPKDAFLLLVKPFFFFKPLAFQFYCFIATKCGCFQRSAPSEREFVRPQKYNQSHVFVTFCINS